MTAIPPIEVVQSPVEAILALREDYRREMNCQIVHDSYHARGFTDSYLLRMEGQTVGYGSVAGNPRGPRETIKEFYVLPAFRRDALRLFRELATVAHARSVEAQTNDDLLSRMLRERATELTSETILFADGGTTSHTPAGVLLRPVTDADLPSMFPHTTEPVGAWGLEVDREIVATGGLMFHYNPPYGDIHMEVAGPHRRRGYGSFLVQELKRLCYERACIPAARCREDNLASRLTLQRAGMLPCGRIVRGRIAAWGIADGPGGCDDPKREERAMKPEGGAGKDVGASCQSCGMALGRDPHGGGTNADGTRSAEYCSHCFRQGSFTEPDITSAGMVAKVKTMLSARNMPPAVVERLAGAIPSLRRWKT